MVLDAAIQNLLISALLGGAFLICSSGLSAATANQTGTDQEIEQLIKGDGIEIAGFLLTPGAAVSAEYDSNLFATRTEEIDDTLFVYRPSLGLISDWQRHEIEMNAGAAIVRHDTYNSEDVEDYWFDASGQIDFAKQGYLFGGAAYSRDHEDRGSPESARLGSSPTQYESTRGHLGLSQAFGNWTVRAGGTAETLSFEDSAPISNEDRDRDMFGAGLRVTYRANSRFAIYGEGIWDKRDYRSAVDDLGFARDSDGYRAGIGVQTRVTNRLHADAYLGYLEQSYTDSRFETLREPDFSARVRFLPGPLSTITARIFRSLEETTLPLSPGYLSTSYSLAGKHRFSQRLTGNVGMAFTNINYVDVDRIDEFWSASASADYHITHNIHIQGSYRHLVRDASIETEVNNPASPQFLGDYAREQFSLTLAADLYPIRTSRAATLSSANGYRNLWNLYAGVAGAHQSLSLKSAGYRDVTGIDEAERAGMDTSAAAFGGLDITFEGWRLGIELDVDRGGSSISEQKTKAKARTLRFDANSTSGLSLLLGRRIGQAGWLIASGGLVETNFDVRYQINEAPEFADTGSDRERGTRWRLGTEADLGARGFLRLDHALTTYDAMTLDLVTETESFKPSQVDTRLGVGVRLQKREAMPVRRPQGKPWRLYGGALMGHSALSSDLAGTHNDGGQGGAPDPSTFEGQFGYHGGVLSGVFMGGDLSLANFRIGIEGEYAGNHASWDHVRSPTGRSFGVDLREETAYSARLGYELASGTLLYARYGLARARFVTSWLKGGNRDNDVERDDRKTGRRWGIGMELPLGEHGLLRSEYIYTRYDDYAFTTSHGAADTMSFDHRVSTFRVGVGINF